MTTAINFRSSRLADQREPLTLQEIFQLYTAWSRLFKTSFDRLLDLPTMTVTGTGGSAWIVNQRPEQFISNIELQYHKTSYRQGAAIVSPGFYFIITTDSSGHPQIYNGNILVWSVPKTTPQEADVRIVFRQQQFQNDVSTNFNNLTLPEIWRSITVYMNGEMVCNYTDKFPYAYSGIKVGFAAYGSDVVTYTNIVVPEMCETAEFGTLDPGEGPMSGLDRTIEGRYLRFFVRWDGSFRAWKIKSIASSQTLSDYEFNVTNVRNDLSGLATRVRMVGAYIWAFAYDPTLAAQFEDRFQELNNPMLLTEQECADEALKSLKRSQEDAFGEIIELAHLPLLEPEDRITTPEGDWLVSDYSYQIDDQGAAIVQMTLRKYVWS